MKRLHGSVKRLMRLSRAIPSKVNGKVVRRSLGKNVLKYVDAGEVWQS
jgi:hypothetical protein